jgi:hypothetical protein
MHSLDADFEQLAARLQQPGALSASQTDPWFYFVYPPEETMQVRRQLSVWRARLRNAGVEVEQVSFSKLLWGLVDASGRWEGWLEAEADADPEKVNDAIRSVLQDNHRLQEQVAAIVGQERPNSVVFLTDTEMLHPYYRVHSLENALHDQVKRPVVVFYPGERSGQFGLSFLGFYKPDGYRATIVGGLP